MTLKSNRWFLAGGAACGIIFAGLLLVRLGILAFEAEPQLFDGRQRDSALGGQERWMAILQNDRRIGTAHSRIDPVESGYTLTETVRMRLNTMGLVQDLVLDSSGRLKADLSLDHFTFTLQSGRFTFAASGRVENDHLVCRVSSGEDKRTLRIPLAAPLYLPAGIFPALAQTAAVTDQERTFTVFDPATMSLETVTVSVEDRETIIVREAEVAARKVRLTFRGITQEAWLDDAGQVLLEKGLLGIRQEIISQEEALDPTSVTAGGDLTRVAAVATDRRLPDPTTLTQLTLELEGAELGRYLLSEGRQRLNGRRLSVYREDLADLPDRLSKGDLPEGVEAFLAPSAFVQADHPDIQSLARKLTDADGVPLVNLRRLVAWMQAHIERRPVLSVPSAVDTLRNRMGDCNEHAVLLAALARAAGLPAQVEAGLVHLDDRFYYHAWNRVYLGRWITVDPLFDQIPADVSHIRFVRGSTQQQLDLVGLLGNLRIRVIAMQ